MYICINRSLSVTAEMGRGHFPYKYKKLIFMSLLYSSIAPINQIAQYSLVQYIGQHIQLMDPFLGNLLKMVFFLKKKERDFCKNVTTI